MWYSGSASGPGIDAIREFWVCCWISSLLWKVFLQYSDSPFLKDQQLPIPIQFWNAQSLSNDFVRTPKCFVVNKYYIYFYIGCNKFTYAIIFFKMLVKTGRIVVLIGQNTSRKQGPKQRPRTCLNMWVVITLPEFLDQFRFLGICPPTPPLSQHYHLLLTQGKMLA